jgi:regulator of extracellular matrix RemA (YlzA/DUF370 family)
MLIDATYGRRTRAVLITDSDHIILSAVQQDTVANRLMAKDADRDAEQDRLAYDDADAEAAEDEDEA